MTPEIVAVYCDGGVIGHNPSPIGGTFAWVGVTADGAAVTTDRGWIAPLPGGTVGNNVSELWAAVVALEAMPDGWAGVLYSDSQNTLGRLGRLPGQQIGWALNGIPAALRARLQTVLARLGPFTGVLLQGHPTQAELAAGVGRRGLPVSRFNVFCDAECQRVAAAAQQGVVL